MEKLPNINPFVAEMAGGLAAEQLRHSLVTPVPADMDCESVITLIRQQEWVAPHQASTQKPAYGNLLRALIQARRPNQPLIKWIDSLPERARPPTKTKPGRPAIPEAQWTDLMWLNVVADLLTKDSLHAHNMLTQKYLLPIRQHRITIDTLLQGGMPPG